MPVTHIVSLCILPQQRCAFRLKNLKAVTLQNCCCYISINGLNTGLEETLSLQIILNWEKLLTERSYRAASTNQRDGQSPSV